MQKGFRERLVTTHVGLAFTTICCKELILIHRDKVYMGLIEELLEFPSKENDSLFGANKLDGEMGNLKLDKLLTRKPSYWKVLARTAKRYVSQINPFR